MKFNKDDIFILRHINNNTTIKRHRIKDMLINNLYENSITDTRANRIIVRSAGKLAQSGCIKIIPDFLADDNGKIDVRRNIYKITDKGSTVAHDINSYNYEEYYV